MDTKTFIVITAWALAIWLLALSLRLILSFVQTDRPWKYRRPNPDKVRPGRVRRLRVVLHYAGCALSAASPALEPLRPAVAAIRRFLWLGTEPVMRLVRKLPVKVSITTIRRRDAKKRTWKIRLLRSEQPARPGLVLDLGPGFVLLACYGPVMKAMAADATSQNPSGVLAAALWGIFAASTAVFVYGNRDLRPARR